MKKIALLFTLSLVGAGQMYGMEPKTKELEIYKSFSQIPELQGEIINKALAVSDNIDEAIEMLKKFSIVHGIEFNKLFANLKDLTNLVHILANRFNTSNHEWIAHKIGTPIADQYLKLSRELVSTVNSFQKTEEILAKVKALLSQGADPNFNRQALDNVFRSIDTYNPEEDVKGVKQIVQLLLAYGAIPSEFEMYHVKSGSYLSSLKSGEKGRMLGQVLDDQVNEIKQMLENAMKK